MSQDKASIKYHVFLTQEFPLVPGPFSQDDALTIQNTPAQMPQQAAPKRTNHSVPYLLFVYRPAANATPFGQLVWNHATFGKRTRVTGGTESQHDLDAEYIHQGT